MMQIGVLPEKQGWELIDGEIIHQVPIGSKHASAVRKLEKFFERNYGDIVIVSSQNPIHIDEHNEPEPDIALLKLRDDFYAEEHSKPSDVWLAIEVSDSTVEYDREVKKTIYAEAGIAEFWLINIPNSTVETYTNPANGAYYQMQIFGRGELIQSKTLTFLSIEVNKVFGENLVENGLEN